MQIQIDQLRLSLPIHMILYFFLEKPDETLNILLSLLEEQIT